MALLLRVLVGSLALPAAAARTTATVDILTTTAVARTSPHYTSWTADCNGIADNETDWAPSACFIGYPWDDPKLQALVKDAYPRGSLMRIGGLADSIWFP